MSKMSNVLAALGVVAALGVAALPLSSYAAESTDGTDVTESATVKLTIENKLSLVLDESTADLGDGKDTADIVATVTTNNTSGYDLKIAGNTAGDKGKTVLLSDNNTDTIEAFTGTVASPAALANDGTKSVWGFTVAGADKAAAFTDTTLYAGVTETGATIASSTKQTAAAGSETTVTFGADLLDNQPAGTYTGTVVFTASDNA